MTSIQDRVREVKGPQPLMSRRRADALTVRQREVLDQLSRVFEDGFNHLTMADLARELNCSLRTLYGLAPSRDQLVLLVVDRHLWRVGRGAVQALADADQSAVSTVEAIRAYLTAANVAVANSTEAFATDCAAVAATRELNESHNNYLIAVTKSLLDLAAERSEIDPDIDTTAVAQVIAGLGENFSRPSVLPTLTGTPTEAANAMVDVILRGLVDARH